MSNQSHAHLLAPVPWLGARPPAHLTHGGSAEGASFPPCLCSPNGLVLLAVQRRTIIKPWHLAEPAGVVPNLHGAQPAVEEGRWRATTPLSKLHAQATHARLRAGRQQALGGLQ